VRVALNSWRRFYLISFSGGRPTSADPFPPSSESGDVRVSRCSNPVLLWTLGWCFCSSNYASLNNKLNINKTAQRKKRYVYEYTAALARVQEKGVVPSCHRLTVRAARGRRWALILYTLYIYLFFNNIYLLVRVRTGGGLSQSPPPTKKRRWSFFFFF